MWHECGRKEMHSKFWWGNLKKRDHLADLTAVGRILGNTLRDMNWTNLAQDVDKQHERGNRT
jgi:hypothetical protein